MKILLSTFFLCLFFVGLQAQKNPLQVECYQLKNGLSIYLNEDHTMPMIHGMVVVKGGSKRDPKDATGIAHYFEHIMFKGTDQVGTINYAEEKIYLDSIRVLYDDLGKTKDEKQRLGIQKTINRISIKAAEYAIPNEFDKLLSDMGGKGVNASTSYEYINYYNSFPSNQIEKWLEIYSHRFIHPVYRLFQSELETVYEEKNMFEDDPLGLMFEKIFQEFYKNSPYNQGILGSTDHLKNPSLSKMEAYFNTYYVANNMALILSGDFDPVKVKPVIEAKFGSWRSGETPQNLAINESSFVGRKFIKSRMTPIKIGVRGYRTSPKGHPDELAFEICANLLNNNSSTGLLDQLRTDNKLLFAGMMNYNFTETGGSFIFYVPKIVGQSLRNAEKLVAEQMSILLNGEFDDDLLSAVKTEMKKKHEKSLEDMRERTYTIANVFLYNQKWEELLDIPEKIDEITKDNIVKTANKYFANNYLAFYSKMGFPKKNKIKKPPYKPVQPKNTDKKSDYARKIEEIPVVEMKPEFIEFDDDVKINTLEKDMKVFTTPNPINKIFSVKLVFSKGNYKDPLVNQVASLFDMAHPEGMKYEEFKRKLQLLGCSFSASCDVNSTILNISGLEDNIALSLNLMNQFLKNPSIEKKQLESAAQDNRMNQRFESKDVYTKGDALTQFAMFGNNSDYLSRLSQKEIKSLTTHEIISKMNEITGYEFDVHYCGTKSSDEFIQIFKQNFDMKNNLKPRASFIEKQRTPYSQNTIFFVDDKKALQSHINFFLEGTINDEANLISLEAFNDYIGGNMSSIIFQEIREFRSLSYGCSGRYQASFYRDKPGYFRGWLSTQADKTNEAIEVYTNILTNMPQKSERIENVRKNLSLSINATQPMLRYKSMTVARWLAQGYHNDPRKARYDKYLNVDFNQIVDFYNTNVKTRPLVITIVGDKRQINMENLKKYGTVKILKKEDIFRK